jgi:urocanate hydratase
MALPGAREVCAPRGTEISTKSWQTEAPLRMLMNNLDPEVAERPDDLVVYGGTGRACRSWAAFDAIVASLRDLEPDETLLVQSGKPVGILRTHEWAPRVLIANSNLVPDWATWEEFRRLEAEGLMMYGQMTAGSWIYIATQGILQGTYETFYAVARKLREAGRLPEADGEPSLAGTLTLTGGCGGMGGAQPLAVTLNGGAVLVVDVDRQHLERRVAKRYLHEIADDVDDAVRRVAAAKAERRALSVGLVGNAADVFPELLRRHRAGEVAVDIVTDQTSAHDPLSYLPSDLPFEQWRAEAEADPTGFTKKARESMAAQVQAMVEFADEGAEVFDYGNSIRDEARQAGYQRAFEFPGLRARLHPPAVLRGQRARSAGWRSPATRPTSRSPTLRSRSFSPTTNTCTSGWTHGRRVRRVQGLPARICWLGYGERPPRRPALQRTGGDGKVKAPIVIGRDHLDSGSVASPYRETEGMLDGSDAVADWPLLNALVNDRLGRHVGVDPPRRRASASGARSTRVRWVWRTGPNSPPPSSNASSRTTPGWGCCGTSTRGTSAPPTSPLSAACACR